MKAELRSQIKSTGEESKTRKRLLASAATRICLDMQK